MNLLERILNTLKENNVEYKKIEHVPVRTSKEAAEVRGCSEEEGAKSLVFKTENGIVNLILEGNKMVDKEKVKSQLNLQKLKMLGADEVLEVVGCEVGGVPPFGNLFNKPATIYLNKRFLTNEFMEFNAGDRSISIRMKTADWVKLVDPQIIDLSV